MTKAKPKKTRSTPKVVVVDADHGRAVKMAERLGEEGFEASACSAARGIIGRIRDEAPDALIVEVILPSMSGFEIAARLQADPKLSHIPIIFMTDIQNSNGENLDYFSRPLHMPSLVRALKARTSRKS
jgi:DNA-binding response OmpR family regulator